MENSTKIKHSVLGLYILLAALYLWTFNGLFFLTDEIILFDMTESYARRGNLDETLTYSFSPFRTNNTEESIFKSGESYEPLQPILAAPLFLLGQFADFNLMHTVWLFNVIVTPLIGLTFYSGVQVLGYDTKTAWWSALLLCTSTMLFPYAQTYFREPLMALFVTIALVASLQIQRTQGRVLWLAFVALGIAFVLAMFTKAITMLLLPTFGLLMWRHSRRNMWLLGSLFIVLLILSVLMWQLDIGGNNRLNPSRAQRFLSVDNLNWGLTSLSGYLFSPSRSMFLFSPVLFLLPWGLWRLYKRGEWRLVLGIIGSYLLFAIAYGILRTHIWHSGWSIGPRYLLPLVPLLMFGIVPLIDDVVHATKQSWHHYGIIGMLLFSIGLQVMFATYNPGSYFSSIVADGLNDKGQWSLEIMPHWRYLNEISADHVLGFWRTSAYWPVIALVLLGAFIIGIGTHLISGLRSTLQRNWLFSGAFAAMTGITLLGFATVDDERFIGTLPQTTEAIETLEDVTQPNDAIVLKDDRYTLPFAATYTKDTFITTLPFLPGEIYGPAHVPVVEEGSITELVGPETVRLYDYISNHYDHLWLVTYFDSFHTFAKRPEERYLAERYFPMQRTTISQDMHLVEFYMRSSSDTLPLMDTNIIFGDVIRLRGYTLPEGGVYESGDVLPVSLRFTVDNLIERDYTLSVMLTNATGAVVTQYDALPVGGFERTSQWQPGDLYHDNRALMLPDDLSAGTYTLQVIIYYWETLERLSVSDSNRSHPPDIAILQTVEVR